MPSRAGEGRSRVVPNLRRDNAALTEEPTRANIDQTGSRQAVQSASPASASQQSLDMSLLMTYLPEWRQCNAMFGQQDDLAHTRRQPPVKDQGRSGAIAPQAPGAALVVNGDADLAVAIADALQQHGWRLQIARSVADARLRMEALKPRIVLFDMWEPDGSGVDFVRDLSDRTDIGIIVVSARSGEVDRVVSLELGADDYIPKPFSRPELLARIRAVLRRAQGSDQRASGLVADRLLFAGWALDTRRRELMAPDGVAVDLSGGEYDLLLAFCEHPQRILSRDQLLDLARNRVSDALDRTVDVMVSRLRRKMEPTEESPTIIKTIRGAGYMFVPAVARG